MKEIKKVNIVGMGALGMLFADIIGSNIGYDNVVFVMDDDRYERHIGKTYKVNGNTVDFKKIRASEASPCDLLIVAVKYTGLISSLNTMKTSIGDDTIIISMLNGITSEEIIGKRYGMQNIIHCVALGMDAMHFGDDLTYTQTGVLCVGVDDAGKANMFKNLTDFFDKASVPYTAEDDIKRRMWSKFMINVGINQTCMVYGTGYEGALQHGSAARMTLISAMREVILIANAEGVALNENDLAELLALMYTLDPKATPSMGQDRINKRKSEVEMFAGTVIEIAKKHNIPVPANEFLYQRVKEIESEY